jgi:hypothetical protein
MKKQDSVSKSRKNYYVDIAMFLPFVMMLITGVIMLGYHAGKQYSETTLGIDGNFWLKAHIVSAIISLVMLAIHLSLHISWFKKLFSGKQKNKYWVRNLILVIIFSLVTMTSLVPWLIMGESDASSLMLGLHNKLGLLLIVILGIHLLSYFKWFTGMTRKIFGNKL